MRGFSKYPKFFWIGIVAFSAASAFVMPDGTWWVPLLLSLALPVLRHVYLFPLGGAEDKPYFRWLKTSPYSRDKLLPNGSIFPEVPDFLVLLLLWLPGFFYDIEWEGRLFYWAGIYVLSLGAFSLILAKHLLILGPARLGYLIFGGLALIPAGILISGPAQLALRFIGIPVLIITACFVASLVGLLVIMKKYPWPDDVNITAFVDTKSLSELFYGHADLQKIGEPFTSLSPRASWPRLSWDHVIGISGIVFLVSLYPFFALARATHAQGGVSWFFLIPAVIAIVLRGMAYYSNKMVSPDNVVRTIIDDLRAGTALTNAAISMLILLFLAAIEAMVLWLLPESVTPVAGPMALMLFYITAFRIPPSRRTWETRGRFHLTLKPNVSYTGANAKGRPRPKIRIV